MQIRIRPVAVHELDRVAAVIESAFAANIAPRYGEEGCAAFRSFATVERIRARLSDESAGWVAVDEDGAALGYVEMTGDHLRMLFVRPDRQRGGIGRRLLEHALRQRGGRDITVNSAPNSDGFYQRMGFAPSGPRQEEHGIVFTPMLRSSDPAPPSPRRRGSAHRQ